MDRRLILGIAGLIALWLLMIAASVYFDPDACDPQSDVPFKRCSVEQLP
jgi:hypothetical protein